MQRNIVNYKLKWLFTTVLCSVMSVYASEQPLLGEGDPSPSSALSLETPVHNAAAVDLAPRIHDANALAEAPAQESSPRGQPPSEQFTQAHQAETLRCYRARYALGAIAITALWVSTYGAYELSHKPHVCKDDAVDDATENIIPGVNWRVWITNCGECPEPLASSVYCALAPKWTYNKKNLALNLHYACSSPITVCIEQANPSENDQQACENNQITWPDFYKKAERCGKSDPLAHKPKKKTSQTLPAKQILSMIQKRSLAPKKVAKPVNQKPRNTKQIFNSGR